MVIIRLLETNLCLSANARKTTKKWPSLILCPAENKKENAFLSISIYSSCNWVRFSNPNESDSNWLSSTSLQGSKTQTLNIIQAIKVHAVNRHRRERNRIKVDEKLFRNFLRIRKIYDRKQMIDSTELTALLISLGF